MTPRTSPRTWRSGPALVTGAGSGMGRSVVWRLASEGIPVAALDVDADGLAHTARRAAGVSEHVCDVSDEEALRQTVKEVEARSGPLETVVAAAGICRSGLLSEQDAATIRRMTEVNYLGVVHTVQATLPGLRERGAGDLVVFGSLAGWMPSYRTGGYSASKAAVVSYVETLDAELRLEDPASGVRIVCVCPSAVDTPMLDDVDLGAAVRDRIRPDPPWRIVDSVERAMASGELFAFPGQATPLLWLRRLSRRWSWALQRRVQEPGG